MKRWLLHPGLTVACSLVLGALFVLAAYPKLLDPPGFAKAIWAYALLPAWSIHPLALVLPWLELLCGVALWLGLWRRAAAAWIAAMLVAFLLALSVNLWRGHPVDCGCFGLPSGTRSDAERFRDMKLDILRDLGMLLLVAQILAATRRRHTQ